MSTPKGPTAEDLQGKVLWKNVGGRDSLCQFLLEARSAHREVLTVQRLEATNSYLAFYHEKPAAKQADYMMNIHALLQALKGLADRHNLPGGLVRYHLGDWTVADLDIKARLLAARLTPPQPQAHLLDQHEQAALLMRAYQMGRQDGLDEIRNLP